MCLWQGQGRCVCLGPRPHNTLMVWSDRWPLFPLSVVLLRLCVRFTIYVFRVWLSNCLENAADLGEWGESGQMRRAENVNAIHWGNQKQRQRQVQVKTVPKICQCSVALGHAICKGFPSGQCCLCVAATPRSPSLDCQLCAQNWCRLSNFHSGFRLQKTRLGGKGAQGGWQATSCQVISINVEAVKCSKSIKRRPNTRNKRSRVWRRCVQRRRAGRQAGKMMLPLLLATL